MLLTGATMGISEIIQCTDASHAIFFQQFNCAAAFGNQAVVQTISNPHHDVVRTISNPHHDVVRTISNPHHIVVRIRPSYSLKVTFLIIDENQPCSSFEAGHCVAVEGVADRKVPGHCQIG